MDSGEYVQEALVTEPDTTSYHLTKERLANTNIIRMLHGCMGICTESGELMDVLKRHLIYGAKLDVVNLLEEHGDLFWYMAILADAVGFTFEQSFEKNIAKLRARYPNKFTEYDALNRNLDTERNVLKDI